MIGRYLELKNLTAQPKDRGRGYAAARPEFLFPRCASRFHIMQPGAAAAARINRKAVIGRYYFKRNL